LSAVSAVSFSACSTAITLGILRFITAVLLESSLMLRCAVDQLVPEVSEYRNTFIISVQQSQEM
jgi:hypothetical protein